MSWLRKQLAAGMNLIGSTDPVTITYRRGSDEITIENVLRVHSQREEEDSDGTMIGIDSEDFLFPPECLVFDECKSEPQSGDQIICGNETFDLFRGPHRQRWKWSDPQRTRYQVHTTKRQ